MDNSNRNAYFKPKSIIYYLLLINLTNALDVNEDGLSNNKEDIDVIIEGDIILTPKQLSEVID